MNPHPIPHQSFPRRSLLKSLGLSPAALALPSGPGRASTNQEKNMSSQWITVMLAVAIFLTTPLPLSATEDSSLKILITVTSSVEEAELHAEVTGGQAPYDYRWSRRLTTAAGHWGPDALDIGGNSPTVNVPLADPFERTWIWCEVTDAKGQSAKSFRRVLPLPPGEKEGKIAFFGIGDSIENAGEGADDAFPSIIAVAAQLCERMMGLPAGGIPWDRSVYPGYTSGEIAKKMPEMLERIREFGATDVFIRMGLNDQKHDPATTVETTRKVAIAVKEGCPSVQRVWIEPCTGQPGMPDRLWKMAEGFKNLDNGEWLFYTCDASHWHQRRAPNLYPDEVHLSPEGNRALGLARAAAWIMKGPASRPDAGVVGKESGSK
jgi:lysophospholipase L1-like esterase